jgi:hypothetical protein
VLYFFPPAVQKGELHTSLKGKSEREVMKKGGKEER